MLSDVEIADMQATVVEALPDTGVITRPAGGSTSRVTGDFTASAPTSVYSGPMHVRVPDSNEITMLFGDEKASTQRYVGVLPASESAVAKDDNLVLTVSTATALVGVPMRVTMITAGSWNLGLRLALEVVE